MQPTQIDLNTMLGLVWFIMQNTFLGAKGPIFQHFPLPKLGYLQIFFFCFTNFLFQKTLWIILDLLISVVLERRYTKFRKMLQNASHQVQHSWVSGDPSLSKHQNPYWQAYKITIITLITQECFCYLFSKFLSLSPHEAIMRRRLHSDM